MARERAAWTMPEWMEEFRETINNTGGNTIEDLMDTYLNDTRILFTNMPRGVLAIGCAMQVNLLEDLHKQGRI